MKTAISILKTGTADTIPATGQTISTVSSATVPSIGKRPVREHISG